MLEEVLDKLKKDATLWTSAEIDLIINLWIKTLDDEQIWGQGESTLMSRDRQEVREKRTARAS